MMTRHVMVAVAGIVGIPFMVSSPGHTDFWVILGAVAAVMLPGLCVIAYFHTEIRRLRREQAHHTDPA